MSRIRTFIALLTSPGKLIFTIGGKGLLNWMSDKAYLGLVYRSVFGKKIDWENPKTFNEKLQWLKLNDRNLEYPTLVDKCDVKKYVAKILGDDYIIPNLGVWETADDIDFDSLPERFVIKCTHDSGSVTICKNKSNLNISQVRASLNRHLHNSPYWFGREWPYRLVKPRIIAEPYLEDEDGQLKDYKFMCFGGQMRCCFVFSDRYEGSGLKLNVYDRNWELLEIGRKYTKIKENLSKPKNYKLMIEFAELLSKNIPFVRVDFYEVNGNVYFGEMTFYPNCGFTEFYPASWDSVLGEWLILPNMEESR